MQTITFECGIFLVTLNEDQARKLYENNEFLIETVLSLINPAEFDKWDNVWTRKQIKKEIKLLLKDQSNHGLCKEYIKAIFKNNPSNI